MAKKRVHRTKSSIELEREKMKSKEEYEEMAQDSTPGYAYTRGGMRHLSFAKAGNKTIARMECENGSCVGIRQIQVLEEHVDTDEQKMIENIKKAAEAGESQYECGTCHTPLRVHVPAVEKRHDTEEL